MYTGCIQDVDDRGQHAALGDTSVDVAVLGQTVVRSYNEGAFIEIEIVISSYIYFHRHCVFLS